MERKTKIGIGAGAIVCVVIVASVIAVQRGSTQPIPKVVVICDIVTDDVVNVSYWIVYNDTPLNMPAGATNWREYVNMSHGTHANYSHEKSLNWTIDKGQVLVINVMKGTPTYTAVDKNNTIPAKVDIRVNGVLSDSATWYYWNKQFVEYT